MFTAYISFNCRPWDYCRLPDSVPFGPKGLNFSLEVTLYDSMLPVYRRLFDENLRILVYSGQGDPTTSHVGMLVLSLASDKIAEVVISQHGCSIIYICRVETALAPGSRWIMAHVLYSHLVDSLQYRRSWSFKNLLKVKNIIFLSNNVLYLDVCCLGWY